jgi:hypothetical protein
VNQDREPLTFDTPAVYRIRIEGRLDKRWSPRLCDLAISSVNRRRKPSVTTLIGKLRDMAALMGVLNTVYDLGFVLLKVERLSGLEPAGDIVDRGGIQ